MNDSAIETLHLDPERLRVVAETAGGYAGYLSEQADEPAQWRSASMRLLAASCWAAIDPSAALRGFQLAAASFASARRLFWLIPAVCGRQRIPLPIRLLDRAVVASDLGPDDLASFALAVAWSDASSRQDSSNEYRSSISDAMAAWGPGRPVGRLGVPLSLYHELLELASYEAVPDERARQQLPALVERACEPVAAAMGDQYHWTRVQSGLLPIEPELLALATVAARIADGFGWPDLLSPAAMPGIATAVIAIVRDIHNDGELTLG